MPSYYPVIALILTENAGPADCFRLPRDPARAFELLQTKEGRRTLSFVLRKPLGDVQWVSFDRHVRAIERGDVGCVTFMDDAYPAYLRDIAQSPALLFYKGRVDRLVRRGVAVVGGRRASARGVAFTRSLGGDVAALGILVASGAARGIDTAAHRGALERGGTTVAALGTGLDVPYPPGNVGLLEEIADSGCVVSEQLLGTPPLKHVFPQRNRLISGFSHVVIVVEARERSGALITARWALEQGRDVGAVPGFPGDPHCRGSNGLIKSGAFLVEGINDILEAIPILGSADRSGSRDRSLAGDLSLAGDPSPARDPCSGDDATPVADGERARLKRFLNGVGSSRRRADGTGRGSASALPTDLSDEARAVFDVVGSSPVDVDTLSRHLGLPAATVQRSLVELELRGLVERDVSGAYHTL